jgi:hypothetical protein
MPSVWIGIGSGLLIIRGHVIMDMRIVSLGDEISGVEKGVVMMLDGGKIEKKVISTTVVQGGGSDCGEGVEVLEV